MPAEPSPRFYHGTRTDLRQGDLVEPGAPVGTAHVYLTPNLDAAIWGAELAEGEGPGRVYIVEPIGQVEDDPAMTDQKAGHPSMSCRSREPLRVAGEITDWQGHSPEALQAMKGGLRRSEGRGLEPIDD